MRRAVLAALGSVLLAAPAFAQAPSPAPASPAPTVDELVARYVERIGGLDAIHAVTSLRRTGRYGGGGGFEAPVVQENRRPAAVRSEFTMQGLTGVTAFDGSAGWKVEPWEGNKDAQSLGEDELKEVEDDADFDGPLVEWKQKGNTVEYEGLDKAEGSDVYKLKVTLKNGDVRRYYLDTDYVVPIKVELKRTVRGAEREFEQVFGDYKPVNGWYVPWSIESGPKGSANRAKVTWERIEANVPLADTRFARPSAPPAKAKE